jgi:hypothetical protein
LEAAASLKSFRPKSKDGDSDGGSQAGGNRNPGVSFHGERRTNQTHASTTDPEARLCRIGAKEARLAYRGHLLIENRNGLIVSSALTTATGTAEEEAALELLGKERERRRGRLTVGADRGYNTRSFVKATRALDITPHVAEKKRFSAVDERTTTWDDYALSIKRRKIVEEAFGWMKTGGFEETPAPRPIQGAGGVHVHLRLFQPGPNANTGDRADARVRKKEETRPSSGPDPGLRAREASHRSHSLLRSPRSLL